MELIQNATPIQSSTGSSPEPQLVPKAKTNLMNKILLLSSPLFLIVALVISIYLIKQPGGSMKVGSKASETDPKESIRQMFINAPLNPTSATAICQSTNKPIESGKPTDCPDPLFTWEGEQVREPGTKITVYYVYFGEKSNDSPLSYQATEEEKAQAIRPIIEGIKVTENKFTPTDLTKGTTYHLAVIAMSDSQTNILWRLGLSDPDPINLTARAAKVLFIYQYE